MYTFNLESKGLNVLIKIMHNLEYAFENGWKNTLFAIYSTFYSFKQEYMSSQASQLMPLLRGSLKAYFQLMKTSTIEKGG